MQKKEKMKKWTILPVSLFAACYLNAQEAPKKEKVVVTTPITDVKEFKKQVIRSVREYEANQAKKEAQPVQLERKKYPTVEADHKLTK